MKEIIFYDIEFVDKIHECNSIYTFRFKPKESIPFIAGQWVHIGFVDGKTKDKSMVRHMSFASSPDDSHIEFTMDIDSDSLFKAKMAALKPGDTIKAFKIAGNFVVDSSITHEVVFVSGGIGITPARSIIRQLTKENPDVKWTLFHVSRDNFLYEKELLQYKNEQIRVNRLGIDAVWNKIIEKPQDTIYYVSGSLRFVDGMKEKLLNSGITMNNIRTEDFS
jgi:ferredoxin-NADP reductase